VTHHDVPRRTLGALTALGETTVASRDPARVVVTVAAPDGEETLRITLNETVDVIDVEREN
jgi:cobalamin biosynthesis protein CbiD